VQRRACDAVVDARVVDVEVAEHVRGGAVCITQHRQQQVVGSNVLVPEAPRFFARLPDDVPCSFGEVHGTE